MDPAEAKEQAMMFRREAVEEATASGDSDIQLFYSNSVVLISGGTGFLGKQLIEKLLRSCNIRKIILLIRSKKKKIVQERFTAMLQDPVFDYLRQIKPKFQDNIITVEGNIELPKLGLSEEKWKTIAEEVTVIIHGAATLKFDEPLQRATLINIRGTREMLALGQACRQLRSFVYISTAYSRVTESMRGIKVMEEFYPVPVEPNLMIQLAETMDEKNMDKITAGIIDGWPNTYCFTKALSEELVRLNGSKLPICIVRPAIVVSSYEEPLPGWLDSGTLYGASGILLGYIMGIIHVSFSKPNGKMDFVPVDLVNNAIIAVCRETAKRWESGLDEIKIYTVTNERNPVSPESCSKILHNEFRQLISPNAVWYMYVFVTDNIIYNNILCCLTQDIPSMIVDGANYFIGKPPQLTPIYAKVKKMTTVLTYFIFNVWPFDDKNLLELYSSMSERDKTIFNFDVANVSTTDMMLVWGLGLRKYVLKDGLKDTASGVKKQSVYKTISIIAILIYIFTMWWTLKILFNYFV